MEWGPLLLQDDISLTGDAIVGNIYRGILLSQEKKNGYHRQTDCLGKSKQWDEYSLQLHTSSGPSSEGRMARSSGFALGPHRQIHFP